MHVVRKFVSFNLLIHFASFMVEFNKKISRFIGSVSICLLSEHLRKEDHIFGELKRFHWDNWNKTRNIPGVLFKWRIYRLSLSYMYLNVFFFLVSSYIERKISHIIPFLISSEEITLFLLEERNPKLIFVAIKLFVIWTAYQSS